VQHGKINGFMTEGELEMPQHRVCRCIARGILFYDVVASPERPPNARHDLGVNGGRGYAKPQLPDQGGDSDRLGNRYRHEILLRDMKIFSRPGHGNKFLSSANHPYLEQPALDQNLLRNLKTLLYRTPSAKTFSAM
jgi:hypothetical protein